MTETLDRYRAMATLVQVADSGSFSAAARMLGLTPAAVSKQIARLEQHLGVTLVMRTTRSQTLTEHGRSYAEHCRDILAEVEEAERILREREGSAVGTLRVTAPAVFGRRRVMPAVVALMQTWPEVRVETYFTDAVLDIAGMGMDVAVRLSHALPDSAMVGRRIGVVRRILVASPAYVARHGMPEHPDALMQHRGLLFRNPGGRVGWRFVEGGEARTVTPPHRLLCDDTEGLLMAALAGQGIADLPDYLVERELATGALVPILATYYAADQDVWALQPERRVVPLKVSEFLRILTEHLSGPGSGASTSH